MAIERGVFPRNVVLGHVEFQAAPQGTGGFSFAADADGEMAAARENPDVAFQMRKELNIDTRLVAGYVVSQSRHGVPRRSSVPNGAQGVAGAGGDDAKIGLGGSARWCGAASQGAARDPQDAGFFDLRAGAFGSFQEQAVEVERE